MPPRPVFLVGFMGSGKSSVGRELARLLERPFIDLDSDIEEDAGAAVAEIFAEEGESGFRDRERAALRAVLARIPAAPAPPVVATGGGTFVHRESRRAMLEAGICIWLQAPLERLEATGGEGRPLYGGPEEARRLLAERAPAYAEAPLRVELGGEDPEEAAAALAEKVRGLESGEGG